MFLQEMFEIRQKECKKAPSEREEYSVKVIMEAVLVFILCVVEYPENEG